MPTDTPGAAGTAIAAGPPGGAATREYSLA